MNDFACLMPIFKGAVGNQGMSLYKGNRGWIGTQVGQLTLYVISVSPYHLKLTLKISMIFVGRENARATTRLLTKLCPFASFLSIKLFFNVCTLETPQHGSKGRLSNKQRMPLQFYLMTDAYLTRIQQ